MLEYYVSFSNFFKGLGEVGTKELSEKAINDAISEGNLYFVDAPNYPKTDEEKKEAHSRFWNRYGEKAYALACNNCEHLVSYILTGSSYSEQIAKAGHWMKVFVDSFDVFVSRGTRNGLKLLVTVSHSFLAKAGTAILLNEVKNAIVWQASAPTVECVESVAKGIAKCAGKQLKCAPLNVLKTAASTAVITGVIEAGFAAYDIWKLKNDKFINEHDCNREVTKRVGEAIGATAGSVAGGLIGQALIPIPIVGFLLGSLLGNIAGRWLASIVSGRVFDGFV